MIKQKIITYLKIWKKRGYFNDIPDEVDSVLQDENLAPSYKAIAIAILKNDHNLESLGFEVKKSKYYKDIKKIELTNRKK